MSEQLLVRLTKLIELGKCIHLQDETQALLTKYCFRQVEEKINNNKRRRKQRRRQPGQEEADGKSNNKKQTRKYTQI